MGVQNQFNASIQPKIGPAVYDSGGDGGGFWDSTVSIFEDLVEQGGDYVGQMVDIVKSGHLNDLRSKYDLEVGANEKIDETEPVSPSGGFEKDNNMVSGLVNYFANPTIIAAVIGAGALVYVALRR